VTRKIRVHRKAYRRRGKLIHGTDYLTPDKGKPGKTPKSERFYHPVIKPGWHKTMDAESRRRLVYNAFDGNCLAAGRSLLELSNTTTDKATKRLAKIDSNYFLRLHKEGKWV
jgi:hypothetical protein